MKKILYIVVLLTIFLLPSSFAQAEDTVIHTDNFTANVTVSSDNFTTNVTISEMPTLTITGIDELTDQLDSFNSILSKFYSLIIAIFLMVIAVWRRTNWLYYVVAGFGWLYFAFQIWTDSWLMSLLLVLVAIACFAGAKWDKGNV